MSPRFPLLSFVSTVLSWVGWILVVLGGLRFALSLIGLFVAGASAQFFQLLVGGGAVVVGLSAVGAGESIRVFIAIEANTRASFETLRDIWAADRKTNEPQSPRKT